MSVPAVTFTNPRTSIRALLDAAMTAPVGSAFPTAAELGTRTAPTAGYVQVGWDGTPTSDYPVTVSATIRATAWHYNPSPAESLAFDVLAVLGSSAGGTSGLWTVRHLTGPLPGVDPDSGYAFAYCTFRVNPKPS